YRHRDLDPAIVLCPGLTDDNDPHILESPARRPWASMEISLHLPVQFEFPLDRIALGLAATPLRERRIVDSRTRFSLRLAGHRLPTRHVLWHPCVSDRGIPVPFLNGSAEGPIAC